eukprot:6330974-Amphidinium_carterae.1
MARDRVDSRCHSVNTCDKSSSINVDSWENGFHKSWLLTTGERPYHDNSAAAGTNGFWHARISRGCRAGST